VGKCGNEGTKREGGLPRAYTGPILGHGSGISEEYK